MLIAKQLVALVTLSGHQAVAVSHGPCASVESLIGAKPELVFVDISLADQNTGLEIAERLGKHYHIPAVFVTANRRRLPANFCNAIGVIDKPFTKLSFERALRYIVARLTHAATVPPVPDSLVLSPLIRTLWNEKPAR